MDFENKTPRWDNVGAEPPEELKRGGFRAGYKPPAAYLNWFLNRIYESVKELQEKLASSLKKLAFKDSVGNDDITDVHGQKIIQDSGHRLVSDGDKASWNGKVDAAGGDISETRITSLASDPSPYPVPAAGDTMNVGFGKIKKYFEDLNNFRSGVCLIGSIVNNCLTNRADLPLSAAQGKALMDLYTALNYDKQKRDWVCIGAAFGSMAVNFAAYTELSVELWIGNDMRYMHKIHLVTKEIIERLSNSPGGYFNVFSGSCSGSGGLQSINTQMIALEVRNNQLSIPAATQGTENKATASTIYVYAR